MKDIYFDNSATTRICPEALAVYNEVSTTHFGNPSSRHRLGNEAAEILKSAEKEVLAALGAREGKIIFTSGGTESNNLAIFGRALAKERFRRGGKLLTTAGEHASVSTPLALLQSLGFQRAEISTLGGVFDLKMLEREADKSTVLLSMMAVNNETGAVYDALTASEILREKSPDGVLHIDATQSFMKIPFTPKSLGADMITVSSHKIEGPKGVGALWVSSALLKNKGIVPLAVGGGQQDGLRSGTENVPAIAAFGEACRVYRERMKERGKTVSSLRNYLIGKCQEELGASVSLLLPPSAVSHILNMEIVGLKSETVLNDLSGRGIYVSSGSACSTHKRDISPALLAYGKRESEADSSIRVSLSYHNTKEEIDCFVAALSQIIATRCKKK